MKFFQKKLSAGNRILDSEHTKLLDIVNGIVCTIITKDLDAMSEAFDLLENCLCDYFALEENIARAANFDFTQHRLAHQNLLNKFLRMKEELMVRNDIFLSKADEKDYIDSLRNCLIHHIQLDTKPLKIILILISTTSIRTTWMHINKPHEACFL